VIPLLFVGEGDLDEATVPPLVSRAIGRDVGREFDRWPQLHGKGYQGKLRYVAIRAEVRGKAGLVVTIDSDSRDGCQDRLRRLREGREEIWSTKPGFPVALGCAIPHSEAWLLDDPVAVRKGLGLPQDAAVPNVRRCEYPKSDLIQLHENSPKRDDNRTEVWAAIATGLDEGRCNHAQETGFRDFVEDVRRELRFLL